MQSPKEFARKQVLAEPYLANPAPINQQNYASNQLLVSCSGRTIEDDGVGFDVQAVQHAGLSVGMRSMTARAERMGGQLQVASGPTGTTLTVVLVLALP
jgi:glucose-6-phosphate-specific signal transduction histidine kinase